MAGRPPTTVEVPGYQRAAVLVPLLFKLDEPHLLFTKRSFEVATHKGQVSFPGGMIEPDDASLEATALRETYEEVGIPPQEVRVLGALDEMATNTSSFVISPFVGTVPEGVARLTSDREVARILEVPLDFLLRSAGRDSYAWDGAVIWGATARILNGFLRILALHGFGPSGSLG
jgi:8-oxo-dGTP pyrophosphatase MutT (NUDIX family)